MGKIITIPFAWIMRVLYSLTGNYGVTLILFTVVVKMILLPFQLKSKKSMVRMGRLSGKQTELQQKYANNKQKYNEEVAKLYQEAGVNPADGCLWSFLPLFILIPLYRIIREPITSLMRLGEDVYAEIKALAESMGHVVAGGAGSAYEQIGVSKFVSDHWASFEGKFEGLMNLDYSFIGLELTGMPSDAVKSFAFDWVHIGLILIPIVSGALTWFQSKVTSSSNGQQTNNQMKGMMVMMPLMSVYIGFILPASLGLYWIANSLVSIVQEATLGKYFDKKIRAEEDERATKREKARQLRMEEAKRHAEEEKLNPQKKEKKQLPEKKKNHSPTNEAGRVGERPYARGRSYVENRYDDK